MSALAARVRGLSPFGPIFGKELRVTARRKRSYLLRVLYLGALLLAMLFVWTVSRNMHVGPGGGGVAARAQAQEQLGTLFFGCFVVFTTIAMMVIGPVLTATSISSERLARTLNVLLMTPITAWQVVSGKLFSRLLIAFTLIGLSLPVLALSRLLGGIELSQMVGGVCLAVVVAIHSAAIGLFFSSFMRRAFAVILLSYATIGFFQGFLLFVGVALRIPGRANEEWVWAHVNWFMAMGSVVEPMAFRRGGAPFVTGLEPWAFCALLYLVLTAILVLCSSLLLRRSARREGGNTVASDPSENIPVAAAVAPAGRRGGPPPPPLPSPDAEPVRSAATELPPADEPAVLTYSTPKAGGPRPTRPRDVSDNPVLWREVRRPLTARRWQALASGVVAVALLLISYAVLAAAPGGALDDADVQMGYAFIFQGLLWLLVSVVSATSVAQEKESDTWTLLLTTPISGRTIVLGKAAGLLRRMMWPAALAVAHFALFTLTGVIRPQAFVLVLWVLFAFNAIWLATGIYLSLRLRTVTVAVIVNLLLAVLAYPVVAVLLMIGGELRATDFPASGYRRGGDAWGEQVSWYLPYSYLAVGMNGIDRVRSRQMGPDAFWIPRDLSVPPPPDNHPNMWSHPYFQRRVTEPTYLAITFGVGVAYLLAALAVLLWTAHRFDRIVGRARQQATGAPRLPESLPPAAMPTA